MNYQTVIVILLIILLLYLFLRKRKGESGGGGGGTVPPPWREPDPEPEPEPEPQEPYTIVKTREVPRKTYLLGTIYGKYWGEIDTQKEEEYQYSKFYDFHIYEAHVEGSEISRTPFDFTPDSGFPRERLPQLFPIIVKKEGKEYNVNIHEPQLANVTFIRKLHQTEGNEVFGTIKATITGYLLDFITEEYTEVVYPPVTNKGIPKPVLEPPVLTKTNIPTGKKEYREGYERIEYYYSDYKTTYWGDWKYIKTTQRSSNEGCLSAGLSGLGVIVGIAFFILLLPRLAVILPFLLLPALFTIIPENIWKWIFRVIGVFLLIGFFIAIGNSIKKGSSPYVPKPRAHDTPEELQIQNDPIANDTLVTHFRSWTDYAGKTYEGKFWVKRTDLQKASNYKDHLNLPQQTESDYDGIVYRLKENDKNSLQGIYQLFDSLKLAGKLSEHQFAEMVVSFVQDIPYSIVLPGGCDPNLYNDDFVRKYLATANASCAGYEHFGINTPVEFLASLKGDCDTRTLLIYTVLAHYGYDVALLSSEHYNHSVIGINLPYEGVAYRYGTQRYVMWETTTFIKPGMLPNEIANTNYWRISLKAR